MLYPKCYTLTAASISYTLLLYPIWYKLLKGKWRGINGSWGTKGGIEEVMEGGIEMGKTGYCKRGIEGGIEPGYRQGVSDQVQDEETGFFGLK